MPIPQTHTPLPTQPCKIGVWEQKCTRCERRAFAALEMTSLFFCPPAYGKQCQGTEHDSPKIMQQDNKPVPESQKLLQAVSPSRDLQGRPYPLYLAAEAGLQDALACVWC